MMSFQEYIKKHNEGIAREERAKALTYPEGHPMRGVLERLAALRSK